MSLARFSCPQVPNAPLRTTKHPVDIAAVGISRHLRRDPNGQTRERLCKRLVHSEDTLEGREAHLYLLADRWTPIRLFGREDEAGRGHEFPHEERVGDVG